MSCSDTSSRVISYLYVRATRILPQFCPRDMSQKFNLLNFVGHVARTKLCRDAMSVRVHGCATSHVLATESTFQPTTDNFFRALALPGKQYGGHCLLGVYPRGLDIPCNDLSISAFGSSSTRLDFRPWQPFCLDYAVPQGMLVIVATNSIAAQSTSHVRACP